MSEQINWPAVRAYNKALYRLTRSPEWIYHTTEDPMSAMYGYHHDGVVEQWEVGKIDALTRVVAKRFGISRRDLAQMVYFAEEIWFERWMSAQRQGQHPHPFETTKVMSYA